MSHDTMPVHIRQAKGVPVLVSKTAAPHLGCDPGWSVVSRNTAQKLAEFCESHGKADRRNTWAPGQRIALQGLARQIRHRLAKKEGQ